MCLCLPTSYFMQFRIQRDTKIREVPLWVSPPPSAKSRSSGCWSQKGLKVDCVWLIEKTEKHSFSLSHTPTIIGQRQAWEEPLCGQGREITNISSNASHQGNCHRRKLEPLLSAFLQPISLGYPWTSSLQWYLQYWPWSPDLCSNRLIG